MGILDRLVRRRQDAPDTPIQANPVVYSSSAYQHAEASRIAVVEACIGLIANCFRQSTIQPDTLQGTLKKEVLASMIRRMLTVGESLSVMEMEDGNLVLNQAVGWDVSGNVSNPNKWRYQVEVATPSGGRTITTNGAGVIHFRYVSEPENPYKGFSPLYLMQKTAGTLFEVESRFDEEAQTSTGQILSMTQESETIDTQEDWLNHYQYLNKLKGGVFVERQNRERGSQMNFAGRTRVGPEYSLNQVYLRDRLHADVASAFGVPIELLIADGEGTATREAFRRFVLTCINPLASNLSEELSLKLDTSCGLLNSIPLRSSDLQGIARAIKALVDSGKSIDEAMALAGLV